MAKDTKDGNNLNEKAMLIKAAAVLLDYINGTLAAYIMELVKGNRTAGYVFVFRLFLLCRLLWQYSHIRKC